MATTNEQRKRARKLKRDGIVPEEDANGGPIPRMPPEGFWRAPEHKLTLKQNTKSTAHRWWARCSCGYVSQSRTSSEEAMQAAVVHVRRVREKRRANAMPDERASIEIAAPIDKVS